MIVSARLQVYSPSAGVGNDLDGIARGQAVDDAPAWTGVSNEITNADKTEATVTIANLPPWTPDTHNDIADVTEIVREIVDRPNWESGNALTIFLEADVNPASHRRSRTYDSKPERGAKLIIDYFE